ncbi:MAG: type II-A CRISPR-associated protein Csn2 [Clostridia bacterium]|nr:type II-A CRISPR-associated protein Csn2 [Clostridia bacterium]
MNEEISISHPHLEETITVNNEVVSILRVENPLQFYKFAMDIKNQLEGRSGEFCFSMNDQIVAFEKVGDLVCDFFNLEINDKRVINLLHKKLEKISVTTGNERLFNELNSRVSNFLYDLFFRADLNLVFNELQVADVLKISSVKFEENYESLLEKIVVYINVITQLKNCKMMVFINLKSVLSDEELKKLYYHCNLVKVGLLLLESSKIRSLLSNERAIIITDDLCEIVENFT